MTTAVFFNLDGTLIDHDLDYEDIYASAVGDAGLDVIDGDYEEYTDRFFRYFQNGWTFPRRQAVMDLLRDRDEADLGASDRFAVAWEDAEAAAASPKNGAAAVVEELAGRYPLGIATNGTGTLQRRKIEEAGITGLMDAILVSSEIGVAKPHADFFQHARQAVEADHYVIVSQELRRDILPAKREEFHTVWLSSEEGNQQVEQLVDRRVASLDDVPGAVDDLCG